MPRVAQFAVRGGHARGVFWRRVLREWRGTFDDIGYRLCAAAGGALMLAGLLLLAALLTYARSDASLDTATAGAPANYLGASGARIADVLLQSVGLAAYLLPAVLFGWALRLLLQRPLQRPLRRLLMLLAALLLAAFACAILHPDLAFPAGPGGAVGWLGLNAVGRAGLAGVTVPLAMAAAAGVALLILTMIGLSPGDWREIGRGAAHVARFSGHASIATAAFAGSLFRRWRADRAIRPAASPAYHRRATRSGERREPSFVGDTVEIRQVQPESEPPVRSGGLVRLVLPRTRPAAPRRADPEMQPALDLRHDDEPIVPPLALLTKPPATPADAAVDEEALGKNARMLEAVLEDYGVRGQIVQVRPGPVVTLYELEPAPGIKASRVIGLADDIARSMSAISVRVAVVPGRTVIGIELPNIKAETVFLRELLDSPAYEKHAGRLVIALGKDIGGEPVIADLARMPHLLIAGTTGSGKSVGINTMILSILYRMPPERCKFIMVDPKMLELSVYDGIPHLLAPVVTEPKKAVLALKWVVREMETRYQKMSKLGVRNIEGFNARLKEAAEKGESLIRRVQTGFDPETGQPVFEEQPFDASELPLIIVVVDEMADLMLVAGKDIEAAVQRLAQMARAAGIHLITATQRPSVDVITGTIKANFPTRISFQVTSKIDSRTILGEGGAEQLLGRGDMLYMAGGGRVTRVHGPFVSDEEVERVVSFLKSRAAPDYIEEITEDDGDGGGFDGFGNEEGGGSGDGLYDQAVALVCRERKASTSFVQRHLQIGYNRAARLIERMESEGVVSQANHVGKREVLAPPGR
jgi:DNA segregation ATPase FtsK/SpoIIIE, S-DNA-T family